MTDLESQSDVSAVTAPALAALAGIAHGFFLRRGGMSKGIYRSLNCGYGSNDEPKNVRNNRQQVAARLGVDSPNLMTLYQLHSPQVITVEHPWAAEQAPRADAMVTGKPGMALGILTADCAAVLFGAPEQGIIGAAHAGWKGALHGVLGATISAMETLGARRSHIIAAIGPCISQPSYEVGGEFRTRFIKADATYQRFFIPSPDPEPTDHWHFDLPAFVTAALEAESIGRVEQINVCTYVNEQDFFSHRRSTHRGEQDYGRNVSAICLGAA